MPADRERHRSSFRAPVGVEQTATVGKYMGIFPGSSLIGLSGHAEIQPAITAPGAPNFQAEISAPLPTSNSLREHPSPDAAMRESSRGECCTCLPAERQPSPRQRAKGTTFLRAEASTDKRTLLVCAASQRQPHRASLNKMSCERYDCADTIQA